MTLTSDIETWLIFTAHPLPKGTLLVEYEQEWAKGRERRVISEGQTDNYRVPAERGPNS